MLSLTLKQIADAVCGKLLLPTARQGSESATSSAAGAAAGSVSDLCPETVVFGQVQVDSRLVAPGDIFFARRGEEADGHDYITQAARQGAAVIICEKPLADCAAAQIVVAASDKALAALAKYVVAAAKANGRLKVIGITGSNGKTSTKNMLAELLARKGNTVANEKSFNNEVGAPLTMLKVCADTDFLVVEMGASGPGEISYLADLAKPDYGVVLMVGHAHAGGFGSLETTAKTKSEMISSLAANGVAVLNHKDARVAVMAKLHAGKVLWFNGPDSQALNVETGAFGSRFTLQLGAASQEPDCAELSFPVLGEHHISNALAAAAVAHDLGLSAAEIAAALGEIVRPAKWRMQVHNLPGEITIINDAYNANPESVDAALKTLAQVQKPAGRSIAVLGEMSELGEFAAAAYDRIGLQAVRLRLSKLVVIGENVRRMYITAVNEGAWEDDAANYFATQEEAFKYLLQELKAGDTVLVKSSNAAGLRHFGDRLVEELG